MFQNLNDDVLIHLFKQLRVEDGLPELSSTCRRLREAIVPILFKRCRVVISTPSLKSYHFPPPSLWSHVRHLSLLDNCYETKVADTFVCRVFRGSSSFLKEALYAMPKLSSAAVSMYFNVSHGLSWDSLEMFLSLPHLREFLVDGFSFCPRGFSQVEARAASGSLAPLTSFRLCQNVLRMPPRTYPTERDALVFVLEAFHSTLESLELPIESAPLDSLASLSWPRLRELKLSGECPDVGLLARLTSPFSHMPPLRVLKLHFAIQNGMGRPLLLLRGHPVPIAFSDLTELSILFPNPDDAIYDNLPRALRRLSLICCPHHCQQEWAHNYDPPSHWFSPILSASDLVHILRRCNTPSLDHLQVEYVADGVDADVLPTMASAFPVLRSLEMSRFREPEGNDVSIPEISRSLASLSALRSLWLHLDFSDVPQVAGMSDRTGMHYLLDQDTRRFREKLRERALLLLRHLEHPLVELWLLERGNLPFACWLPFRVVHSSSNSPDGLDAVGDQHLSKSIVPRRF